MGPKGAAPAAGQRQQRQAQQQGRAQHATVDAGGSGGSGSKRMEKNIKDARAALAACRKSPQKVKQMEKLLAKHPSGMLELFVGKAELIKGILEGTKSQEEEDCERELRAAGHLALERVATAATEHRSLLGLSHAVALLRLLHGLPDLERRNAQRARLLAALTLEGLEERSLSDFAPLEGEAFEPEAVAERWVRDGDPRTDGGRITDPAGLLAYLLAEYQQRMADAEGEAEECDERTLIMDLARREGVRISGTYLLMALRARLLQGAWGRRRLGLLIVWRLPAGLTLPGMLADLAVLNSWVKERQARRQAKQEALEQLAEQRAARQEAAAGGCAAPGAEEKRQRMAEVVKARQRAFKLEELLMQQLQATGAASASGSSGEQQQQQQVEALLRLASMSLPEFQQHLLAAGQAGDASTLAAGGAAEPAALAQQLLDGKVAAVMYELPFAEAGSPASTASYYECQRRLREAVDDPSAKAECLAELAEQLPAVKVPESNQVEQLNLARSAADVVRQGAEDEEMSDIQGLLSLVTQKFHRSVERKDADEEEDSRLVAAFKCSPYLQPLAELTLCSLQVASEQLARLDMQVQQLVVAATRQDRHSTKAEMLLKQALLGRQMIELVLPQQAGREAPRQHGPQRRGWRDSLGSLGMLAGRALGDVDSSDSSEEEPSSSAGPTYFAGSSNGGSPGARGSASGGGRGSPPVRLPPAEELVQLQQVADGLVGLTFEEAFERCSLPSTQRQHALLLASRALELARGTAQFFHLNETAALAAALLPIPGGAPWLGDEAAGEACFERRLPPLLAQVRMTAVERVLGALRHLEATGRLSHVFLTQLKSCLENQRNPARQRMERLAPGALAHMPWTILAVMPLGDLLLLYGMLCLLFADEFAAGPADLSQQFQEAIALGLAGAELQPGGGQTGGVLQPQQKQQPDAGAEAAPVLALSRLGLARALATAAAADPQQQRAGSCEKLIVQHVEESSGVPLHLPTRLPGVEECAKGLAACAAGVPAVVAAANEQPTDDRHVEVLLAELRQLRLWQRLMWTLSRSSSSSLEDKKSAVAQANATITNCKQLSQQQPAVRAESVHRRLCGGEGSQGLLRHLAEVCRSAARAITTAVLSHLLMEHMMAARQARSVAQLLERMLQDVQRRVQHLSRNSALRPALQEVADRVEKGVRSFKFTERAAAARAEEWVAALTSPRGKMLNPDWDHHMEQLERVAGTLEALHEELAGADCTGPAAGAAVLRSKEQICSVLEAAKGAMGFLVACLYETTDTAQSKGHAARTPLTRHCARATLAPLAQQLMQQALPHKWLQQLDPPPDEATAASGLLRLGSAAPCSGSSQELEAAAAMAAKAKEEAAAAAAVAAAEAAEAAARAREKAKEEAERRRLEAFLLQDEHREAAKKAKQQQKEEAAKRKAAEQKAAAAAAEQERQEEERRQRKRQEEAQRALQRQQEDEEEQRRPWQERQQQPAPPPQQRQQQEPSQRRQQAAVAAAAPAATIGRKAQQQLAQAQQSGPALVLTPAPADKPQRKAAAAAALPGAAAAAGAQPARGAAAVLRPQAQAPGAADSPRGLPDSSIDVDAELEALQHLPLGPDGEVDLSRLEEYMGGSGGSCGRPAAAAGGSSDRCAVLVKPTRSRSANSQRPTAAAAAPPAAERPPARFVSWSGAWVCECGEEHAQMYPSCKCGVEPCRRWFYGDRCNRQPCRLQHLQFNLADQPTPDEQRLEQSGCLHLAQPNPDAIYRPAKQQQKQQRGAKAAPAKPAAADKAAAATSSAAAAAAVENAWRRRQASAMASKGKDAAAAEVQVPQPPAWGAEQQPQREQQQQQQQQQPAGVASAWAAAAAVPGKGTIASAAEGQVPEPASWGVEQQPQRKQQPQQQAGVSARTWAAAAAPALAAGVSEGPGLAAGLGSGSLFPLVSPRAQPAAAAGGTAAAEEDDSLDFLLGHPGISTSTTLPDELVPAGSGWSFDGAATPAAAEPLQLQGAWPAPGEAVEVEDEDETDAELAAAIQASLADVSAVASSQQAQLEDLWRQHSPQQAEAAQGTALGLPGLRNETGEYNCFLNVIIQCLWRCAEFRQLVAGWDAAFCDADAVLGALHALFQQFEEQEAQRRSGSALTAVDPSALREALAQLPGQQFGLGEMSDAAEVLLCVYERAMEVAARQGRPACVDATFGLAVAESVHCHRCGKVTQQSDYVQYCYNTQAATLRTLCGLAPSLGQLLRVAEVQHQKSCDEDVGGCGAPNAVYHFLQHPPRVFTLQLAWESESETPESIAATVAAVDEQVDLGEVYQGADRGRHVYRLRSMVCYYGQHYQALVLDAGGWLMLDDANVSRVGSFADVKSKCQAGHIQPSMLFFEAVA